MPEQGGFKTDGDSDLVLAAAGRIKAAIDRGQTHFDDMERSHRIVLAGILAIIPCHRDSLENQYRQEQGEQSKSQKSRVDDESR
ncbi:hypothetical protein QQ056_11755 [Oscillatoria laete-virens NRMC-F 0139]|nr:hypothetical protein [Oscillatoria laete-virens NRMC-F 0139]